MLHSHQAALQIAETIKVLKNLEIALIPHSGCANVNIVISKGETLHLPGAPRTTVSKKTVLIVEDDPDACSLLRALVEARGFVAMEAVNGMEAVEIARREKPGLILMDIFLPLLDGYEATRQIREDAVLRQVPIIAVTAAHNPKEAFAAGCNDFIPKPIDIELFQRILDWLSLGR